MTTEQLRNTINGIEYPYISVTSGMSGYFAVMIWWNPEMGGFEEPWDTGILRTRRSDMVVQEAKQWAKEEDIDFRYAGEVVKGNYKYEVL